MKWRAKSLGWYVYILFLFTFDALHFSCDCRLKPQTLLDYTSFSPASILEAAAFIASKMVVQVQTLSKRHLVAVKRKYEESKYKFISSDFEPPSVSDILTG
jgi:hypothetical protein